MANRSDRRRKTPCVDEERQSSCKRLGAGARIAHQGPMPIPREASLVTFLQDGHLEIDNNLAENAIRPFAVGRNYPRLTIMQGLLVTADES